jgi:hypothetical protein
VSVPTGVEGIRVRFGRTRGTFQQGEEKPTLLDQGDATFTTRRAVFQGPKYTREWDFSKLIGVINPTDMPWTAIQVRNRDKTSGIGYPPSHVGLMRTELSVAVAIRSGQQAEMIEDLKQKIVSLDAEIPASEPQIDESQHPAEDKPERADSVEDQHAVSGQVNLSKQNAERPGNPPAGWFKDPLARHKLRTGTAEPGPSRC